MNISENNGTSSYTYEEDNIDQIYYTKFFITVEIQYNRIAKTQLQIKLQMKSNPQNNNQCSTNEDCDLLSICVTNQCILNPNIGKNNAMNKYANVFYTLSVFISLLGFFFML